MKRMLICAAAAACVLISGCSLLQRHDTDTGRQRTEFEATREGQAIETTETTESTVQTTAHGAETETEEVSSEETAAGEGKRGEIPVNTIILATDMHYLARELTDGGPAFQEMVDHGDGKVVPYISEIMDAFLDEVIEQKPGALILSGDVSFEGERLSHEELARKLERVRQAGIPVLVIPGNHDINNPWAARYSGIKTRSADTVTPEEFQEIYRDYGYRDGVSYDPSSLSYVYRLDEGIDLLMLDSCQYEPENLVGGSIGDDTYEWIEDQLAFAHEDGRNLIPISHHNLLEESEVYADDCTIEHSSQLIRMLEEWNVSIYLSGHLHVQHMDTSEEDGGILEIVTSSLATPPCQYGILDIMEDGGYRYRTRAVDVEQWARRVGEEEMDLTEFSEFKNPFLERVFYNQAYDQLEKTEFDPERKRRMAELYARLNRYYYAGRAYEIRDEVLEDPYYELWDCEVSNSILPQYILSILTDAKQDYNSAVLFQGTVGYE